MEVKPTWYTNKPRKLSDSILSAEDAPLKDKVITVLRAIYDPEISVNIYDLGLIYALRIDDSAKVQIDMTLTSPACPVAGILPEQVARAVKAVPGVKDAQVDLVWEPPWDRDQISDEAKLTLGLL